MLKYKILKTEIETEVTHLTSKQAAKRLHKETGTLANWRVKGIGPKFIRGKPALYPLSEIEIWERSKMVTSTSQKRK